MPLFTPGLPPEHVRRIGGEDVIQGGDSADKIHVGDNTFFEIDGGTGDTHGLEAWDAKDPATLPGYVIYGYDSIQVAVDVDMTVTMI